MKIKNQIKSTGLILVVMLLFATSCEKVKEKDLVGTWTIKSTSVDAKVGNMSLIDYLINVAEMNESDAQLMAAFFTTDYMTGTIEIKDDGTYVGTEEDDNEDPFTGTWKLSDDGETLTLTEPDDDGGDDYVMAFEVVKLTNSEMELKLSETDSWDINEDNVDEEITFVVNIKLSK